jgi:O-antigen/teichoic acid export membrane protein
MSKIRQNVVANFAGQAWTALMGFAFVPLYIRYLGMEAYGLIGLFAMLQAWLTLLDMGMTPTLSREMSRFTGGAHSAQSIRDLLRSLEFIAFAVALLIGAGIWGCSGWLASDWLKSVKLPIPTVAHAFAVMGGVTALRFVEGLYRGALVGLQKQVLLNVLSAVIATVRAMGAVAILAFFSADIGSYFLWQGVISLLSLALLATVIYRALPAPQRRPSFSKEALTEIWHFAACMMATTLLSLLLSQVDKVILSRLLNLEEFGQYSLAGVVSGTLSMIIAPVTQAYYPRMTELVTRRDNQQLIAVYHRGAQLITVLVGSAAAMLMFFGERLVALWTGNPKLAAGIATLVALQAVGLLLNGLMHIPYMLQLAHGWSSFAVKLNSVAVAFIVPAFFWATPRYGAVGAAWVWVALNAGYVIIGIQLMHRRLIPKEKWRWYFSDMLLPLGALLGTAFLFRSLLPQGIPKLLSLCLLMGTGVVMASAALMASSELRGLVLAWFKGKNSVEPSVSEV